MLKFCQHFPAAQATQQYIYYVAGIVKFCLMDPEKVTFLKIQTATYLEHAIRACRALNG